MSQKTRRKVLLRKSSLALIAATTLIVASLLPAGKAMATTGVGDTSSAVIYDTAAPMGAIVTELADEDDDYHTVAAPWPINFFGIKYDGICVTTNGAIFPVTTSLTSCTDYYDLNMENMALSAGAPMIAAISTDIDLSEDVWDGTTVFTGTNSDGFGIPGNVYYGTGLFDGRDAVFITWYRAGFNDINYRGQGVTGSITLQIVLIKKPTSNITNGYDFDIQYNIGTATNASDGYNVNNPSSSCSSGNNLIPGNAAYDTCRWGMGIANYVGPSPGTATAYELFPNTPTRLLIDSGGATALVRNSLNSAVKGRYTYSMIGGVVTGFSAPQMGGGSALPPPAPPQLLSLALNLAPNDTLPSGSTLMSGSGLQPGSKYTLTLRSEPVVLFTGNADPSGYFDTEFNLSSVNCPTPGRHTLTLTGVRPDGSQTSAETAFSIDEGCRVSSISRDGYDQTDLATVYFSSGSSKLSNKAKASIKSAVEANPAAIYRVIGYVQKSFISRNDGSLSLSRARAVANYLGSLNAEVNFTVVSESGFISPVDSKSAKARKATLFAVTPSVR
jgi:hypothetical protein